MPRLNNNTFIKRHLWLRRLWLEHQPRYGVLGPTEQWAIHDYYQPSHELSNTELLAHRAAISKERPALPAQASKAFKVLIDPRTNPNRSATFDTDERGRTLRLTGVVNPEIDVEKLARVLLEMAERLADKSHDESERRLLAK